MSFRPTLNTGAKNYLNINELTGSTGTWTDIVEELRTASATNEPIGMDLRFTLVDAADYIELLRRRLEKAERPWWRRFW